MKRAASYTRYSSDRQNEASNEDQDVLNRRYAAKAKLAVIATYSDAATSGASTLDRFGWLRLMADARRGLFEVIVVESISRAFRDQADYHAARKLLTFREIEIHTIAGPLGALEGSITAMMSERQLVDLAQMVHRGQEGAVRRGQHVGPPAFGYKLLPPAEIGKPAVLAIDDTQAAIVRRIFRDYADGASPRAIAVALNDDGIASPRGKHWNASTLHGSRKRQNGILQNALYDGRMIWNRQRFLKNPETNTRVSRLNPQSEWVTADAPELRIVDRALWKAVQARREARAGNGSHHTAPRHLLSGLIKCGACGASYTVAGTDKRGKYLRCAGYAEGRGCGNHTTLSLAKTERRVIESIQRELGTPDLIAEYVREFHKAMTAQRRTEDVRRQGLARELSQVEVAIGRIIASIEDGLPARPLANRLSALETKKADIESALAAMPAEPVHLHPKAADLYRRKIKDLATALKALPARRKPEVQAAMRELVEKIVVRPTGPYKPANLELHGRLAAILQVSQGAPSPRSLGVLVAGERNTRPQRLPALVVLLR